MPGCTLTGHSGQDEFDVLFDSVPTIIGQNDGKLCPSVATIHFRMFRTIVTRPKRGEIARPKRPCATLRIVGPRPYLRPSSGLRRSQMGVAHAERGQMKRPLKEELWKLD